MQNEPIKLMAISKGPCEACQSDTWVFIVRNPVPHDKRRFIEFRWCPECTSNYATCEDLLIYDHLRSQYVSSSSLTENRRAA